MYFSSLRFHKKMLPCSFVFNVLVLPVFLYLCFVVYSRAPLFSQHPPLYNAALYVDKVLSSEPIIAAYVNTLSCKKLVIPFPIFKRIEKMVVFVNKQSRRKSKKFISSYFESYAGFRNELKIKRLQNQLFTRIFAP